MTRFQSFLCCTALALMTASAQGGVMNPIPGDPITIESGKLAGTVLDNGVKAYYGVPFAACAARTSSRTSRNGAIAETSTTTPLRANSSATQPIRRMLIARSSRE